jgi:uroporphyrinogen decarboxylase
VGPDGGARAPASPAGHGRGFYLARPEIRARRNPHALHSLDPQAAVDIAELKRCYGERVCLIGNVNCGKLDTGSDEEVIQSARYALHNGMPGGSYIFSTSNCIYTGMRLARYELMLDVWRVEGNYR